MEKPGKTLDKHSIEGDLITSNASIDTNAVALTFKKKGIKKIWTPDRDKELMISDVFISGFCNEQNKNIQISIEIRKNNKWISIGTINGFGTESINFNHSFSTPISVDVGGLNSPKIRGKIRGDMNNKNFEITFTVLAYYKEEI